MTPLMRAEFPLELVDFVEYRIKHQRQWHNFQTPELSALWNKAVKACGGHSNAERLWGRYLARMTDLDVVAAKM